MKITILLLIIALLTCIGLYAQANKLPISDHSDGRRFHNLDPKAKLLGLLYSIKWRLTSKREKWPESVPNEYEDLPPSRVEGDKIRVSFIGHATFLIQTQSLNILTDPVYSERCSPFSFVGPKRVSKPGIQLEKLPKIDVIMISHNHYDHMDIDTLKELTKNANPKIIVPLGNAHIIKKHLPNADVKELDWHDDIEVAKGVKVYLEPAQHWSARGIFDLNESLWGTFVVGTKKGQICFVGDTGYDQAIFKSIATKFPDIRLSLIPIGAYEPRWFMKSVHMNPEEAAKAHLDLNSRRSIASHFITFQLADEGYDKPVIALEEAKKKLRIDNFDALKIGQFMEIK